MAQIRYLEEKRRSCGCCTEDEEHVKYLEPLVRDCLDGSIEESLDNIRDVLAFVVNKLAEDDKISVEELELLLDELDYNVDLLEILEEK